MWMLSAQLLQRGPEASLVLRLNNAMCVRYLNAQTERRIEQIEHGKRMLEFISGSNQACYFTFHRHFFPNSSPLMQISTVVGF